MVAEIEHAPYWWNYAVAGVITILFGLGALLWPGLTVVILILLFGIFAIVEGVLALVDMFRRMGQRRTWWPQLVLGVVGIVASLFVFAYPGVTAFVLLYVIAFWALATGLIEVLASLATGQLLLLIIGVLTIVFGFILLENPTRGALALITVIGAFAVVRGILLLFEAARAPEHPAMPA